MNTPKRRSECRKKKKTWFRKGGQETVLFVQATPNSALTKKVKDVIALTDMKIQVVEKSGTKIKRMLQKNDPFKKKKCNDVECFVCSTTEKGEL